MQRVLDGYRNVHLTTLRADELNRDLGFCPQGTFASYVSRLCPYFTMLRELQSFSEDLNCSREIPNCTKFPPNTYIAYWTVVKEFLDDFNSLIIQIETKVKKRGMCFKFSVLTRRRNDIFFAPYNCPYFILTLCHLH